MTTIIVRHEDRAAERVEYGTDVSSITIGRRPSNTLCLADRSVSGRHARIDVADGAVWIEDLGSTNGTYVNGQAVGRQQLMPDDDILLGKLGLSCEIAVAKSNTAASGAAPLDQSLDDSFDEGFQPQAADEDDDDELDESMRAALALYNDDSDPEPISEPALVDDDDDDLDFSEDARLFAQSTGADDDPQAPGDADIEDAQRAVAGEEPLTLSDRAKVALGREAAARPRLRAVNGNESESHSAADSAERVASQSANDAAPSPNRSESGDQEAVVRSNARPLADKGDNTGPTHDLDGTRSRGAVIQIKNGAKSGQILPIDKPVTTLGRPGIQIAAIMRKPDGYFLMHIESDDSIERPTLNADSIGDEPVLLHSGDELNVAGIDVEFMLS